jgi:DNA-binding XRE family transcriptional regulator
MAAGHSQESFAHACSCHRTYMGLVERGAVNASIEIVGVIARTLGMSLVDLMAEVEQECQAVAGGL